MALARLPRSARNDEIQREFILNDLAAQKLIQQKKLKKALKHLDYSFKKVTKLSVDVEKLDEETLQTWESFTIRFVRVCDIFLAHYIPTLVELEDPGFSGTLHDCLNFAEKIGVISNAKEWLVIHELRNITTYEYSDKELGAFFITLRDNCPKLLAITNFQCS